MEEPTSAADVQARVTQGLQSYCEQWNGSPVLVLHKDLITQQNLLFKPILIKVIVYSLEASNQTDESTKTGSGASVLEFTKSITVMGL